MNLDDQPQKRYADGGSSSHIVESVTPREGLPDPPEESDDDDGFLTRKMKVTHTVHIDMSNHGTFEAIRVLPQSLTRVINAGDLRQLSLLIETFFEKDCIFTSRVMKEELIGRHYIYDLFEALLTAIPGKYFNRFISFDKTSHFSGQDYILVARKSRAVKNRLSNQVYFTGTRCFVAKNQHLFQRSSNCSIAEAAADNKHLNRKCVCLSQLIFSSQSLEVEREELIDVERRIKESGKNTTVWGGGFLHMTFDFETFKVNKFEMDWGVKTFRQSEF